MVDVSKESHDFADLTGHDASVVFRYLDASHAVVHEFNTFTLMGTKDLGEYRVDHHVNRQLVPVKTHNLDDR